MVAILILLEGSIICAVAAAALLVQTSPLLDGWGTVLRILLRAGGLAVSGVLAFYYAGLYELRVLRRFDTLISRIPRTFTLTVLLTSAFAALAPTARLASTPVESGFLLTIAVVFGPLLPLRATAYWLMKRKLFAKRLLIVGTSLLSWQLIEVVHARPDCRYTVAGVAAGGSDPELTSANGSMPASLVGLDAIIDKVRPHEIVVALATQRGWLPGRDLLEARVHRGIAVHDGVALYERLAGKLPIEQLVSSYLVFSSGFRESRLMMWVRRSASLVVAGLGLLITAPLLGPIALAITLDSPGPALFRQRRIGFRGKPFTLLKFRTMYAEDQPRSEWVRDNGHRITRVGRWLRRCWLDELPQLVNILRGDMDLVGPRPHPASNAEPFTRSIPFYTLRSAVRPGLTGWAQIRYGYANDVDEETEKMCYDLYYIKHRSLWLDLRILLETMKMLMQSRDAFMPAGRVVDVRRIEVFPAVPAAFPLDGNGARSQLREQSFAR